MKIGFIGAGRVGCSFGKYLKKNKIAVSGYYSRNYENAKFASDYTNSICFGDFYSLAENSDIIFITVKDSAISEIWNRLSFENLKGKYVCHCSGALSSEIFEKASDMGVFVCSVHPMLAVCGKDNAENFAKAFFTVEGNFNACHKIKKILESIGNSVKIIENSQKKSLYHLACVFQSNLINALIYMGCEFLKECGFSEKEAINAASPLIYGNIDNILKKGVQYALTGPVERRDISTIEKHMRILNDNDGLIYRMLSLKLAEIAQIKNSDVSYDKLKKFLEGFK